MAHVSRRQVLAERTAVLIITVIFLASLLLPLIMPTGFDVDRLARAVIGLAFVIAAYMAEAVRGGLQALPKGQYEAADALGLTYWQKMRLIILPQALRLTIAPLTNRTIAITKGTALGTVVAVTEILGQASSAMSNSYNPSPLMMGAAAYIVLFLPVVIVARWIETRFAWKR